MSTATADVRNLFRPPCSNMKHESQGPKPRLRVVFPGFIDVRSQSNRERIHLPLAPGCLSEQCEARSGCNFRCCRPASVSMRTANVIQPTGSELAVDFQRGGGHGIKSEITLRVAWEVEDLPNLRLCESQHLSAWSAPGRGLQPQPTLM